jgi:hypothetical protein
VSETTTSRRRLSAAAFDATFDRIVEAAKPTTIREKAAILGLPSSSLGHMVKGTRSASTELVFALMRIGFTPADLDAVCVSGHRRVASSVRKAA